MSAESCPGCGGRLEHEGVSYAYVTDIPPTPRPDVRGYRVQIADASRVESGFAAVIPKSPLTNTARAPIVWASE